MIVKFFLVGLFLYSFYNTCAHAQLEARLCGNIPEGLSSGSAVYDERDYIYIFGKFNLDTFDNRVYKFDIRTESFELVAHFSEDTIFHNAAMGTNGFIFYFGLNVGPRHCDVYKFSTESHTMTKETTISTFPAAVVSTGELMYLFGGEYYAGLSDDILEFNSLTYEYRYLANAPFLTTKSPSAWNGNNAFIFGYHIYEASDRVLRFNPTTSHVSVLNETINDIIASSTVVTVDDIAYIFGGNGYNSVQLFDTNFETVIDTLSISGNVTVSSEDSVYVSELKRIYLFGGGEFQNDVVCIDLVPANETYPEPERCSHLHEGLPCEETCEQCGFCEDEVSFYFWCDTSNGKNVNGRYVREECKGGLWWNSEAMNLGDSYKGTCDFWENLSVDLQEHYLEDERCFAVACHWGQDEECSSEYWYTDPKEGIEQEEFHCPTNGHETLLWDMDSKSCQFCQFVQNSEGEPCPC